MDGNSLMYNETIRDHLMEKHPGAFEGWDGFEISFSARERKGGEPLLLVCLYNKGGDGYVVDMHASFLVTLDEDGQDVIRVGGVELAQEYDEAYIPELAK
jgi:hypothetical protein